MLGCGQGGTCCGSCAGMGGYSATERALLEYAQNKLATGQPFYISPLLNSDALRGDGMGFLPALIAAVAAAAPTIANVVGTVAAVKGMKGAKQGADPNAVAAAILPSVKAQLQAQGVNLPDDAAGKITLAGVLDAFGESNRPLVIAGLAGLGVMVLLKLMKG